MSITEIARTLNKNQHSVGRYLDILLVSGHVEMRMYGKAKVYSLSSRVPLNTIMGGLHDLLLVLDNDNRIVQINDQFLQLIKKARKDMLGKDIAYLPVSEPAADIVLSNIRLSLESDMADREIILNNGDPRVYRQKIIPAVFEDGGSGTIILLENITDRTFAETALRSSEEQFRLMADNIQDGVSIYRNRKLIYMNRRVEEILGYSRNEFLGLSPLDIIAPGERDRMEQVLDRCSSTDNVPSEISTWVIRKDGTQRYVSSRITSIRHGTETTMYIVVTDMTEWKHAQDALENQLVYLQHMINTFPNPLFYLDVQGRYLGCNSAFERLTGKNLEDLAGKTNGEIAEPWDCDLFDKFNAELFEQGGVKKYSGKFPGADGHISEIILQKTAITSIEGNPAGIIGIILSPDK